ncbi:carboxypeptidase-like regulatory domain-containing protein [Zunongwangia profunda]|uniref:Carboxypeptidase-like, regulatory region n=1 Tax=Zunongwangia profunda (strain DSM 18752 / CCTCC AB 206139 / SM-A87) TaxID=655815 RepID=D5BJJ8_ZUNPS|nr:carboxypeptidase-like regulatory domain-containing protein [Zunongwangia profunda]ADF51664.1 carboxypeptidase-like, regulatory region [Zunongwangia profunda SM-A87]|tara:strand:- start:5431 stop:6678 length:1248 start_codon:yes stop_codon:yes gene_type:complete
MKRCIFLIVIALFSIHVIAQEKFIIEGRIIDKETKTPLVYASIIFSDKSLGTTTDENGNFTFPLFDTKLSDSISITYMGYKPIKLTVAESMKLKEFELIQDAFELNEVVINTENINLKQLIKETVKSYNKNRREQPHIAIAHYREKAKKDHEYIMYMESIGYSIYAGTMKDATLLSNYKFFCENTKAYVSNSEWKQYKSLPYELPAPSGGANLNIFRYIELYGLLSEKHYRGYSYKIDSTYLFNNNIVYSIRFKGDIAEGTIHIFKESKEIFKIECTTNKYWSRAFHKLLTAKVRIAFNYFENTPFVSSINAHYENQNLLYQNDLEILVQKFQKFSLNENEYWSLNNYDGNPYIQYDPQEWRDLGITKDKDHEKIESDIPSLEKEFQDYSGRWFFVNAQREEIARTVIRRLKENF